MKNEIKTCRSVICIMLILLLTAFSFIPMNNVAYAAANKPDYKIKLSSKASATVGVAKQLDGYMKKGKSVDIYVRGSKKSSAKTIKALQKKVQRVNTLGVIFTTKKAKKAGKSYIYRIRKKESNLYKYSTRVMDRMWKDALKAGKKAQRYNYDFEKTDIENESLSTANTSFSFSFYLGPEYEGEAESYKNMIDNILTHKHFCELSDAQKVYIIDVSNYFCNYFYSDFLYGSEDIHCMEYDKKSRGKIFRTVKKHPDKVMKAICQNKAKGVCADFSKAEILLFSQLGMKAYYLSSGSLNHAWSIVKVSNSKGKKFYVPFDYSAAICSKQKLNHEYKAAQKFWKDRVTRKSLWKENNGRPKDLPKKMNYSWEDIR